MENVNYSEGELVAIITLVVITICLVIIIIRFAYDAQRIRDHYVSPLEELHRFGAFVEACEINEGTQEFIIDRMKKERASLNMNDPDFCNTVDDIRQMYEKRFAQLIKNQ